MSSTRKVKAKVGTRSKSGVKPASTAGLLPKPYHDAIFKLIDKNAANGHWLWTGRTTDGDYGVFPCVLGGHLTFINVHRYVYKCLVGPINPKLELDHRCRTPPCCNPAHLKPVTKAVNLARRIFK